MKVKYYDMAKLHISNMGKEKPLDRYDYWVEWFAQRFKDDKDFKPLKKPLN